MKKIYIILILLICYSNTNAQTIKCGTVYNPYYHYDWKDYTSIGIYTTGMLLDINSSWNKYEGNKLFRNSESKFSSDKYLAIYGSILGGSILVDKFLFKNNPKLRWITFGFRTTIGSILIYKASKNYAK